MPPINFAMLSNARQVLSICSFYVDTIPLELLALEILQGKLALVMRLKAFKLL